MATMTRTPAPQTPDAEAPRARFATGRLRLGDPGPRPGPRRRARTACPSTAGGTGRPTSCASSSGTGSRRPAGHDELRYLRDLAGGLGAQVRTRAGAAHVWEGRSGGLAGLGGQRVLVIADRGPDGKERLRVTVGEQTVCDTARGLFVPGKWLDTTRGALPELERAHAAAGAGARRTPCAGSWGSTAAPPGRPRRRPAAWPGPGDPRRPATQTPSTDERRRRRWPRTRRTTGSRRPPRGAGRLAGRLHPRPAARAAPHRRGAGGPQADLVPGGAGGRGRRPAGAPGPRAGAARPHPPPPQVALDAGAALRLRRRLRRAT